MSGDAAVTRGALKHLLAAIMNVLSCHQQRLPTAKHLFNIQ